MSTSNNGVPTFIGDDDTTAPLFVPLPPEVDAQLAASLLLEAIEQVMLALDPKDRLELARDIIHRL